jgi:malate/lactate dehydrogenase
MDIAGFKPHEAHTICAVSRSELPMADIIIFCAGVKAKKDKPRDMKGENRAIIDHYLLENPLKKTAIVITLPGPVEYFCAYIQHLTGLPRTQVIGFGGELDKNRLLHTLVRKEMPTDDALAIGGHASKAIPLYRGEKDFESVMNTVRNFLSHTGALAGQVRNLATAPLLAGLIASIVEDKRDVQCVSGYHPDYGLYMLWPFMIGSKGTDIPVSLLLSQSVQKELDLLLEKMRAEQNL